MTIKVVVTTYIPEVGHPRGQYLRETLESLYEKLGAPEPLEWLIAHDGPADHPDVIRAGGQVFGYRSPGWSVTGGERVGIGGSLNRALDKVWNDELWVYTTDDWKLNYRYGIGQAVQLIREMGYDYVRLGPPHPDVVCKLKHHHPIGWWLELNPECGGFAFATRPFVASRRLIAEVGTFRENCDAYECERNYADRVRDSAQFLKLAEIVNGSLVGPWEHIGEVEVGDRYP